MKNIILIPTLLLLFFAHSTNGQNSTFEYLLSTPLDERFTEILEMPNGDIFFSARLSDVDQPYKSNVLIAKLDNYGNLVDSIFLTFPGKSLYVNHLFYTGDNEFTVVTSIHDTLSSRKSAGVVFYNMNEELSCYNQTVYYVDSSYTLDGIFANIASNGNIMASIAVRIPPQVTMSYFYVFNSSFDSLKAKFYQNEAKIIFKLKDIPNSNYWIVNMLLRRYEILDTTLNIILEQKIPEMLNGNYGIKWDTDTSFYMVGADHTGNNLGFIRQFHPLDTTGYIYNHWNISDTVDYPALWGGIDFKNKDSIFIGGTRNMWLGYHNPWPSWFIILQTDSLLNIRWERFYGGDAYYMMGKLIATNDGGCLASGTRYDYLNTTKLQTDIIILKLNSEGLITSNQGKPTIEMREAIVYPNPGTDVINVRIAVQYKQSVFELFDINGRHILKENFEGTLGTVNTTFIEQGTYIYRITSNDGLFESGKWVKQ